MGVLFALLSAAVWGAGDLGGGIAARRSHQFQVVFLSAISGLVVLLFCWAVVGEAFPSFSSAVWAVLAGISGVFGISALYRGLSLGNAALVAPTAGVVGALVPVFVNVILEGWPGPAAIAGFGCALAGIWLVAQSSKATIDSLTGLRIAFLAGLGLGGFLALIAQVPGALVFGPLAVARVVGAMVSLLVITTSGLAVPGPWSNWMAVGAGVLDAGGTIFYVFAKQHTRLDVAAVLSSLYPVSTVLLARLLLQEHVSVVQGVGVGLCLLAVALIAA